MGRHSWTWFCRTSWAACWRSRARARRRGDSYITGDTLIFDELQEIPRRFADIDLALLHLEGTRVLGILVSMDAAQGVEAMRIVDPARANPVHYNDYDVFTSSLEEFLQAAQEAGLRDRVHVLRHGDRYDFPVRL